MKLKKSDLTQAQVLLLSCFAFFCFGTHDAISKFSGLAVGFALGAIMIQSWRAIFILTYITYKKDWESLRPKNKNTTFIYCFLQAVGMVGFYFAVIHLPLVELFIIILLRPAVTILCTKILLKERISNYQFIVLLLGLLATGITFQVWNISNFNYNLTGVSGGLINVIAMSARYVIIKKYTTPHNINGLIFYSSIAIALAASPFLQNTDISINFELIIITAFAGFLIVIGDVVSLIANHSKYISTLVLGQFTILIWVGVYGWIFFSETPSISAILGSLIILCSGIFLYFGTKK